MLVAMNVGIRTITPPVAPERPHPGAPGEPDPEATWVIEELPPGPQVHAPVTAHDRRVMIACALAAVFIVAAFASRWLGQAASTGASANATAPSALPSPTVLADVPAATPSAPAGTSSAATAAMGVTTVGHIDRRFAEPGSNGSVLAVWMETGSTSTACLATLNEAAPDLPGGWINMYCAARDMRVGDAIRHGLFLHMFLAPAESGDHVAPTWGGYYDVNVYQEGATYYGTPLPWVDPYAPAAAENRLPVGTHDGSTYQATGAESCYANGWAIDPDHADARVPVRILVDGRQAWSGPADTLRLDVKDAGIGDGRNGFWVTLGELISPDVAHEIRAQAQDLDTGEWVDLAQTPRTITCTR